MAEKEVARFACYERAEGVCEVCERSNPLSSGHLHHERAKRRWGWMESDFQRHIWLCMWCHGNAHNAGGKPVPKGEWRSTME